MGKYARGTLPLIDHYAPNPEDKQRGRGSYVCGQVGDTSTLPIIQNLHFETKTAVNPLKRLNILTHIFCS